MSNSREGSGNVADNLKLSNIVIPLTPAPFSRGLPVHQWLDTNPGKSGSTNFYPYFVSLPPGVTSLTQLPTFPLAAQYAAVDNYPAHAVVNPSDGLLYEADSAGVIVPGLPPLNVLPTPLRQLRADESIDTNDIGTVPELVTNSAPVDRVIGPGGPSQAQWQALFDKVLG